MTARGRDRLGGALMLAIGVAAAARGVRYDVGSLTNMGPGFFPVAVGTGLAAIGLCIVLAAGGADAAGAMLPGVPAQHSPGPQWRGWTCIALGLAGFVVVGEHAGLVPAAFTVTFLAALGDRRNGVVRAGLLAAGIVVVAVVVFWWALGIQFALFQAE